MAKFGVCLKKPSAFVRVQHQIEQTHFQECKVRISQRSMYGNIYAQTVPNIVNFLYNVVAVVVVVAEVLSSVSEGCLDILVLIRL